MDGFNVWCLEEGISGVKAEKIVKLLLPRLTSKQRIVVSLLYKGNTYKQISDILGVSKMAISKHIKLIRIKARKVMLNV